MQLPRTPTASNASTTTASSAAAGVNPATVPVNSPAASALNILAAAAGAANAAGAPPAATATGVGNAIPPHHVNPAPVGANPAPSFGHYEELVSTHTIRDISANAYREEVTTSSTVHVPTNLQPHNNNFHNVTQTVTSTVTNISTHTYRDPYLNDDALEISSEISDMMDEDAGSDMDTDSDGYTIFVGGDEGVREAMQLRHDEERLAERLAERRAKRHAIIEKLFARHAAGQASLRNSGNAPSSPIWISDDEEPVASTSAAGAAAPFPSRTAASITPAPNSGTPAADSDGAQPALVHTPRNATSSSGKGKGRAE